MLDNQASAWAYGRKPRDSEGNYIYKDPNGGGLYAPWTGEWPTEPEPPPAPAPAPEPSRPPTDWLIHLYGDASTFDQSVFVKSCAQVMDAPQAALDSVALRCAGHRGCDGGATDHTK